MWQGGKKKRGLDRRPFAASVERGKGSLLALPSRRKKKRHPIRENMPRSQFKLERKRKGTTIDRPTQNLDIRPGKKGKKEGVAVRTCPCITGKRELGRKCPGGQTERGGGDSGVFPR